MNRKQVRCDCTMYTFREHFNKWEKKHKCKCLKLAWQGTFKQFAISQIHILPCKQFLKLLSSIRQSCLFIIVSKKNVLKIRHQGYDNSKALPHRKSITKSYECVTSLPRQDTRIDNTDTNIQTNFSQNFPILITFNENRNGLMSKFIWSCKASSEIYCGMKGFI